MQSPEPSPSPEPTPQPSPTPTPPPGADDATLIDQLGTFEDIEDLDLTSLLEVTSTEGGARTADDSPGATFVMTEEDIRRTGARGVTELLEAVPGLAILTDNLGRPHVVVRGIPAGLGAGSSENVLVLLNGLRLNENAHGGATAVNLDVPVDNVKRLEVVRGPGAVAYGPGAFLAVVNIVTEGVDTFRKDELTLGAGSFRSFLYNFRYGTTWRSISLAGFLQFTYTGGPELEIDRDLQSITDDAVAPLGIAASSFAPGTTVDDRKAVDANLGMAWRDFALDARLKEANAGGYVGLLDVLGVQNRLSNKQVLVDARWGRTLRQGDVRTRLSFGESQSVKFLDVLPPGYTLLRGAEPIVRFPGGVAFQSNLNTRRYGAEVSGFRSYGPRHQSSVGIALERESTFDLVARSNLDPLTGRPLPAYQDVPALVPAARRTVFSLYAQDAWSPTSRLGFLGGLRLDRYTDYGGRWMPRIAAVYRARREVNLKLGYQRAVRTPSFGERFFSSPAVQANPDLEPTTIDMVDASVLYRRRDLRVVATAYVADLDDVVVPDGAPFVVGRPQRLVNAAGMDSKGLELEATRDLPHNAQVQGWLAFQAPRDETTGEAVPGVPRRLARLSGFFHAGRNFLVSPSLTWHGGRTRAPGDPRAGLPSYALVDVAVRVRNLHERIELIGTLHNLFDVDFVDPSPAGGLPGDYPRPGLAAFLKVRYRF
jgi:iron complex outermembrane receptor protein